MSDHDNPVLGIAMQASVPDGKGGFTPITVHASPGSFVVARESAPEWVELGYTVEPLEDGLSLVVGGSGPPSVEVIGECEHPTTMKFLDGVKVADAEIEWCWDCGAIRHPHATGGEWQAPGEP